ncbi:MAG TPA: hypothetical protein VFK24_08500 [Gammaproteobacteria bacterium]|nr:hypothetical protein [Gammaproteobacteria bacterium]
MKPCGGPRQVPVHFIVLRMRSAFAEAQRWASLNRPALFWIGRILGLAALAYFLFVLWTHRAVFRSIEWSPQVGGLLILCLAAYLLTMAVNASCWYLMMRSMGSRRPPSPFFVIYGLSQFGKYVPGNVAHHIGRIALSRFYSLRIPNVIVSMGIEMAWMISVAAVLGVTAVAEFAAIAPTTLVMPGYIELVVLAVVAMAGPLGLLRLTKWILSRRSGSARDSLAWPHWGVLFTVFVLYAANFLVLGWVIDLLGHFVFGSRPVSPLFVAGGYAVAWVAGFIIPGAPAGAGVRDALLVIFLSQPFGIGTATGVALLLRLISLCGDFFAFAAAWVGHRLLPSATS